MRTILFLLALPPLSAGEDPNAGHTAALVSARLGDWRSAEAHQRRALESCQPCSTEDRAILRADLAGYLTLGGFPEAAIPLWKQSLAELAAGSRLRVVAFLGLGVAYHAAGRERDAQTAWKMACRAPVPDLLANASCRFNLAVSRMETANVWSELEEILPVLLTAPGPLSRATALLQTARAATLAGQAQRAVLLLEQADSLIASELNPKHPFRALVYEARAHTAVSQGDAKAARKWRKKAADTPQAKGWERGTVSLGELKGERR